MSTPPKKYTVINGVMKLNPEYKKWKEAQNGGMPATTVPNTDQALPVVTSMEDHDILCQASTAAGGSDIPLAESTNATIEMMQEPEICLAAGMAPDTMVDDLGKVLNKYEVPMGLMNKLMMLSEYESLEFIIDDSGSMGLDSDTLDPITRRPQTRWKEAQTRLKEMIEILAYVPFNKIDIMFLNRPDKVELQRMGRNPDSFITYANSQIDQVFVRGPASGTPALERLRESYQRGRGKNIARYFFGDGIPNGGKMSCDLITKLLCERENPAGNPITFLSCTNEDEQVEWMKDAEEVAPYCSECDDYKDECEEVLRDQGVAFPYTRGFYLVCSLVAAMCPDDLDAMDESVPFTKTTLDNILGIQHNEQTYRHYFDCFKDAQRNRIVELDERGQSKKTDQLKKSIDWETSYQDFLRAPVAKDIPAVRSFKEQLKQAAF